MKPVLYLAAAAFAATSAAAPAAAGEVFGGLYVHDVDTPLSISGIEGGTDVMLGLRGGPIGRTPLQPYVFGALNTAGETSFAAAGISARFGDRLYIRPGVGVAIHNGSAKDFQDLGNDKIDFGSRVLFAPELGIGLQLSPRASVEASWIHLSHGQLFGRQNPGMDDFGIRANLAF